MLAQTPGRALGYPTQTGAPRGINTLTSSLPASLLLHRTQGPAGDSPWGAGQGEEGWPVAPGAMQKESRSVTLPGSYQATFQVRQHLSVLRGGTEGPQILGGKFPLSEPLDPGQATRSLEEPLLALRVSTALSGVCVLLEAKTCSLGQVSRSSHRSDDNRFVCALELVCAHPTIFSSH